MGSTVVGTNLVFCTVACHTKGSKTTTTHSSTILIRLLQLSPTKFFGIHTSQQSHKFILQTMQSHQTFNQERLAGGFPIRRIDCKATACAALSTAAKNLAGTREHNTG